MTVKNALRSPKYRALLAKMLREKGMGLADVKIPRRAGDRTRAPLSFAQERLWWLDQLDPDSAKYSVPVAVHLSGSLHVSILEWSLNEVVHRHEILRTAFVEIDGNPTQVIVPELTLPLHVVNLREVTEVEWETTALRWIAEEARRPLSLARAPLLRVTLLQFGETKYVLVLVTHQIVFDRQSAQVLIQELMALYKALLAGEAASLPELPIQYADFAHWQRGRMKGEMLETQLAYWRERFGATIPLLRLPTDHARTPSQIPRARTLSFRLPADLSVALRTLSQREEGTLFVTLLAAFQALLCRYTAQENVLVFSSAAGRSRTGLKHLIGLFANYLALYTDLSGNPGFRELLGRVRETVQGANAHQDLPFEQIVESLRLERGQRSTSVFQVMFTFQYEPIPSLELPGLDLQLLDVEAEVAPRFDLDLLMEDTPAGLTGMLRYKADLFEAATVTRLWDHFETLLRAVVRDPDARLWDLPLPLDVERSRVSDQGESSEQSEPQMMGSVFVAPRTPVEKELATIWADVLGLERVGVHDNFFELGGDSLLSLRVAVKAKQAGLNFTPRQFFQHQTIAALAAQKGLAAILAEQGVETGTVPLSPGQNWFFESEFPDPHWWNISQVFSLSRDRLIPALLEEAVKHVLSHHDALRSRFVRTESGWQQNIVAPEETDAPFSYIDLSEIPEETSMVFESSATEVQQSLNLSAGPLLRFALFDRGGRRPYQLLVVVHHLVLDNTSFHILMEDLMTVYEQLGRGEQAQLPPRTVSFKRWTEQVHTHVQTEQFQRLLDNWLALPWEETAPLPVDYPGRGERNISGAMGSVWTSLSVEETNTLLNDLPKVYGARAYDALLMALVQSVTRWTKRRWAVINVLDSGRTMGIPGIEDMNLSRTVGWLATSGILLLEGKETDDPEEALRWVKEQLGRLPKPGIPVVSARLSDEYHKKKGFPDHVEELIFNYLGRAGQPAKSLARRVYVSTGEVRNRTCHERVVLACTASVEGRRLFFVWGYGKNAYKRATVEKVAEDFMDALRSLIRGCQSSLSERLPNDFVKEHCDLEVGGQEAR